MYDTMHALLYALGMSFFIEKETCVDWLSDIWAGESFFFVFPLAHKEMDAFWNRNPGLGTATHLRISNFGLGVEERTR